MKYPVSGIYEGLVPSHFHEYYVTALIPWKDDLSTIFLDSEFRNDVLPHQVRQYLQFGYITTRKS